MLNIISRTSAVITIISLGLALSGCGYNTIPTLEEQAKARWSDVTIKVPGAHNSGLFVSRDLRRQDRRRLTSVPIAWRPAPSD